MRHNFYNLKTILEYIFSQKASSFGFTPHYFIFLVPFLAYFFSKFKFLKLVLFFCFVFTLFLYKKEYPSFSSYQKVIFIIEQNQKYAGFNIANLTYGDTQAWPLRYLLYVKNLNPNPTDNYSKDRNLWVLSESDPRTSTVWELQNFKGSILTNYYIDEKLQLYNLVNISK